MSELVDIVFSIELSLVIGMVTSFILGCLLFLIKVPSTEYSKKIINTKNTIAVCYLVLSMLFYFALRYSGIKDYEVLASLMMFVITATASVILSYSLITVLDPSKFDTDKFVLNLGLIVIMSFVLGNSFWWESHSAKLAAIISCVVVFIAQCIGHIVKFNAAYVDCVKKLEQYYDDEEDDYKYELHGTYNMRGNYAMGDGNYARSGRYAYDDYNQDNYARGRKMSRY